MIVPGSAGYDSKAFDKPSNKSRYILECETCHITHDVHICRECILNRAFGERYTGPVNLPEKGN